MKYIVEVEFSKRMEVTSLGDLIAKFDAWIKDEDLFCQASVYGSIVLDRNTSHEKREVFWSKEMEATMAAGITTARLTKSKQVTCRGLDQTLDVFNSWLEKINNGNGEEVKEVTIKNWSSMEALALVSRRDVSLVPSPRGKHAQIGQAIIEFLSNFKGT